MIGKISLIIIFFISLVFSGDILSRLASIRLFSKEIDSNTFGEIESAELNLVVPYLSLSDDRIRNHENVAFRKLYNNGSEICLKLKTAYPN